MVVTRELKFIFLHVLTLSQCTTGYNFMCNLLSKIILWILTPLVELPRRVHVSGKK